MLGFPVFALANRSGFEAVRVWRMELERASSCCWKKERSCVFWQCLEQC